MYLCILNRNTRQTSNVVLNLSCITVGKSKIQFDTLSANTDGLIRVHIVENFLVQKKKKNSYIFELQRSIFFRKRDVHL